MTATAGPTEMDQARQPNHYELLEVPPGATRWEIVQAYHRARAAFAPNSLATYALFTPEEARAIAERVETAFRVLVDARARDRYDRSLGAQTAEEADARPGAAHDGRDRAATAAPDMEGAPPPAAGEEPPPNGRDAEAHETPAVGVDENVDGILASVDRCDGSVIARLREARSVTLDQINLSTKISPMNLRFIEADDFASLPAPVYLRGYLRQIAGCLSVDADWVVTGYMARVDDWRASDAARANPAKRNGGG